MCRFSKPMRVNCFAKCFTLAKIMMHPLIIQITPCLQGENPFCSRDFCWFSLFLKVFTLTFLHFAFLACLFLFQEKKEDELSESPINKSLTETKKY